MPIVSGSVDKLLECRRAKAVLACACNAMSIAEVAESVTDIHAVERTCFGIPGSWTGCPLRGLHGARQALASLRRVAAVPPDKKDQVPAPRETWAVVV